MTTYLEAVTALGKGSLHPGGFRHTLNVLSQILLSADDIVLDIGCGTGRTACHIAKNSGAFVFALDNSKEMLEKAKYRTAQEDVQVEFLHYDAGETPFQDEVIDLILIESVLIFSPVADILQECRRILKKEGILLCVEMYAGKAIPNAAKEQIQAVCNLPHIPSFEEWLESFRKAGFAPIRTKGNALPRFLDNINNLLYPDPYQVLSPETESNQNINNVIQKYSALIQKYSKFLGFATLLMKKQT